MAGRAAAESTRVLRLAASWRWLARPLRHGCQHSQPCSSCTQGGPHPFLAPTAAAMEAARSRHQAVQAREARTASLTAAFQAAGLQLAGWRYRLPGLEAFLAAGQGNAEALVAQAQAAAGGHAPAQHGYVV